jgi:hypothetical protein
MMRGFDSTFPTPAPIRNIQTVGQPATSFRALSFSVRWTIDRQKRNDRLVPLTLRLFYFRATEYFMLAWLPCQ